MSDVRLRLPEGLHELRLSDEHFQQFLDFATQEYVRQMQPRDDASITLHLALKQAARMLLWFAGRSDVHAPKLARKDDPVIVVIRYILTTLFQLLVTRAPVLDASQAQGFADGVLELSPATVARLAAWPQNAGEATDGAASGSPAGISAVTGSATGGENVA